MRAATSERGAVATACRRARVVAALHGGRTLPLRFLRRRGPWCWSRRLRRRSGWRGLPGCCRSRGGETTHLDCRASRGSGRDRCRGLPPRRVSSAKDRRTDRGRDGRCEQDRSGDHVRATSVDDRIRTRRDAGSVDEAPWAYDGVRVDRVAADRARRKGRPSLRHGSSPLQVAGPQSTGASGHSSVVTVSQIVDSCVPSPSRSHTTR